MPNELKKSARCRAVYPVILNPKVFLVKTANNRTVGFLPAVTEFLFLTITSVERTDKR